MRVHLNGIYDETEGKEASVSRFSRSHILAAFDGMRSRDEYAHLTTADFPIRAAATANVRNPRFMLNLMHDSDGSIVNTDTEADNTESASTDEEDNNVDNDGSGNPGGQSQQLVKAAADDRGNEDISTEDGELEGSDGSGVTDESLND